MKASLSAFQLITGPIVLLQAFLIITFKLSLTDCYHTHPETPKICYNFNKRGVGDQELPETYSSASVGSKIGWESLPSGSLALLAGPVGLMVTQTTKFNKIKVEMQKDAS